MQEHDRDAEEEAEDLEGERLLANNAWADGRRPPTICGPMGVMGAALLTELWASPLCLCDCHGTLAVATWTTKGPLP